MKENTDNSQLNHDAISHVADEKQGMESSNGVGQGVKGQGSGTGESQNVPNAIPGTWVGQGQVEVLEKNDGADEICQHCGMTMVRVENDPGFLPFETVMFRYGDSRSIALYLLNRR
jgi:hypothetical protein